MRKGTGSGNLLAVPATLSGASLSDAPGQALKPMRGCSLVRRETALLRSGPGGT